ncbi:MAG: electron transport complex subunit RsxC [Zoogloeaceae bacterium]|jgi:electron transport complex protein RnfC|nr:electron transport complex subunit RsxC [Zoogloeaceae bacterium]
MLKESFPFFGGIRLAHHKYASADSPVAAVPLPERLVLPLRQSTGVAPSPVVAVGGKVKKGDILAAAEGWVSASLHAPTSGTVVDIGPRPIAHPSGLSAPCIVIETDGEDAWSEKRPLLATADRARLSPKEVQDYLQGMGVVGLGGAMFPSHVKLTKNPGIPLTTLIVNGAECEPFITSDDRLMRERAPEIVSGALFLRDVLEAEEIIFAIEDNKPEAIAAMRAALPEGEGRLRVAGIPSIYPGGSLRQLIHTLTGKRMSRGVHAPTLGVQGFNAATVYSVWRAVAHGEPVTHRIVTVTGNVERPGNLEVPLGMSIRDLLAAARSRPNTEGVIVGGPMMGFLLPHDDAPIGKGNNCLIACSPDIIPKKEAESPCIRCTSCAQVCPQGLQPFELYWWSRARDFDKVERYHIAECIECGCCAYVCPASIPLVQYFRFAKSEIHAAKKERKMAENAKKRFEFRQFRLEREKAERAEKLAKAAAAQAAKQAAQAKQATSETPAASPEDEAKQAIIAAAVERARAQREEKAAEQTTENPS